MYDFSIPGHIDGPPLFIVPWRRIRPGSQKHLGRFKMIVRNGHHQRGLVSFEHKIRIRATLQSDSDSFGIALLGRLHQGITVCGDQYEANDKEDYEPGETSEGGLLRLGEPKEEVVESGFHRLSQCTCRAGDAKLLRAMESSEFAALTQEEQIRRIEILGRQALREFGIEPTSVQPLIHAENTTFRVSGPEGEFCLRICRPGYQSDANVASEIAFVGAMRMAGFDVPRPYQDRVVKVGVDQVPEPRNCVLLGWQEGEFAKERLTPTQSARIGEAMARMHEFATHWTVPEGFDRQGLHPWETKTLAIETPNSMIEEADRQTLVGILEESRRMFKELPRDPDQFGLIHGDLHRGNVLFAGEETRIIDFDDTGWAFWLADFSAALAYELRYDSYPEVRDAMLKGYESVRPLPPRTRELLPAFLRIRIMTVSDWLASRSDNPQIREVGGEWVKRLCESVDRS